MSLQHMAKLYRSPIRRSKKESILKYLLWFNGQPINLNYVMIRAWEFFKH